LGGSPQNLAFVYNFLAFPEYDANQLKKDKEKRQIPKK